MRPVSKQYKMHFGFGEPYPPELKHLTIDGKHHGYDYLTPVGVAVKASVNGVITEKGYIRGFGNSVWIKFWVGGFFNKRTYRLILAHLDKIITEKNIGEKIRKEEIVGSSGDSGTAKGHPHLHAEVQEFSKGRWTAINPVFAIS